MTRIVSADEISGGVVDAMYGNDAGTTQDCLAAAITAWLAEQPEPDHIPDVRKMVPEQNHALSSAWSLVTHAVEQASAQGFQAGAEAMREASAQAYNCYCDWRPTGAGCYCPLTRDKIAAGIRALPIPEMPA
jgi:hypothetical protein